jgi:mycoredoxin
MLSENGVLLYGTAWCGDCRRVKRALEERGADYQWIDLEKTKGARAEMLRLNGGARKFPTILFPDGSVMTDPSVPQLAARLDEIEQRSLR